LLGIAELDIRIDMVPEAGFEPARRVLREIPRGEEKATDKVF
jgi:hypothetical protein